MSLNCLSSKARLSPAFSWTLATQGPSVPVWSLWSCQGPVCCKFQVLTSLPLVAGPAVREEHMVKAGAGHSRPQEGQGEPGLNPGVDDGQGHPKVESQV